MSDTAHILRGPVSLSALTSAPWGRKRERVLLRTGSADAPYTYGRVRVFRLADGMMVWHGFTDADAYYEARGLPLADRFVSVATDMQELQEATAAGPWLPDLDPAMAAKGFA